MTITAIGDAWSHQALNPKDPRLPVEVIRSGQIVTGDGSGGTMVVNFPIRLLASQARKSSQIYAIASFHAQQNNTSNQAISVTAQGFELGAAQNRRTWGFQTDGNVGSVRTVVHGLDSLKNALLGSPSAIATDAVVLVEMTNVDTIILTAAISLFRFLPTVFQAGGPLFPQGEY